MKNKGLWPRGRCVLLVILCVMVMGLCQTSAAQGGRMVEAADSAVPQGETVGSAAQDGRTAEATVSAVQGGRTAESADSAAQQEQRRTSAH